jgi:hypothetical protein
MNPPSAKIRPWTALAVIAAICCAALLVSPFRYAMLYNFIPVCMIGSVTLIIYRKALRNSPALTICALVAVAAVFHCYNIATFGVSFEFDGKEYWSLARGLAEGHGFSGAVYRPPLYPAMVGLFITAGDARGLWIVIFQHAIVLAAIAGTYALGRLFSFSNGASLIAASLMAVNSLLMQSTAFIMTEIVFMGLALGCLAALKLLFESPTTKRAILTGSAFAAASYCRGLLLPLFICGCMALALKKGKPGIRAAALSLLVFFGATAPWCVRNFLLGGHYAMSAGFGVQAFTKATAFHLENPSGRFYKRIEAPLDNVLRDMGRFPYTAPKIPEDDWQINRVPHALMDSLQRYHGYSFFAASDMLGKAAMEGFIKRPIGYVSSIAQSFSTLLFAHRELYPSIGALLPVDKNRLPPFIARMAQGGVYVSGFLFLLFPLAALLRKKTLPSQWAPFCVVCMMYLLTAAVQIGFTRYSIPWEPLKILCAAFAVETAIRFITKNRLTS